MTEGPLLAVLDGGMICGWRRPTPSLGQLHQAVFHLHAARPELRVSVVADPSLKHALSMADQALLDGDIEIGALAMAPAGTIGGFGGFLQQVVQHAAAAGLRPVVVTDRAVPGAVLGKVHVENGRWLFDLDGAHSSVDAATIAAAAARSHDRGPRRPRKPNKG